MKRMQEEEAKEEEKKQKKKNLEAMKKGALINAGQINVITEGSDESERSSSYHFSADFGESGRRQ